LPKPELSRADSRRGLVFSFAGALCSALYLFPYKRAAAFAPAHVLAFALLVVAALLTSAVAVVEARRASPAPRRARDILWGTSALLAIVTITGNWCGAQAVSRLEPAIASVLLRTEVVFVGGLAALLLGERLTPALGLGALTALFGLVVMRWPLRLDAPGEGAAWALGAAASFGLMQVATRRVIEHISPLAVNALRLWLAVALLALVPGTLGGALAAGPHFWCFISAAGLFGPCLGRLCIMYSLRTLRAAHSALLLLLAPVLAFVIGYIGWGTLPTASEVGGGALMLVGIALPSLATLLEGGYRSR
jgi:drug/metabolite transporter (DMT)-like permease